MAGIDPEMNALHAAGVVESIVRSGAALNSKPCHHCGSHHPGKCSRIKAIEYYPGGSIKRIEYHDPWASIPPQQVQAR